MRRDSKGCVTGGKDLAGTAAYPPTFVKHICKLWRPQFQILQADDAARVAPASTSDAAAAPPSEHAVHP